MFLLFFFTSIIIVGVLEKQLPLFNEQGCCIYQLSLPADSLSVFNFHVKRQEKTHYSLDKKKHLKKTLIPDSLNSKDFHCERILSVIRRSEGDGNKN